MKVGLLGFGKMAQALTQGWISQKVLNASDILACAAHYDKLQENAARYGITALASSKEVCQQADVIVVLVKPNLVQAILEADAKALGGKMVVCPAAGIGFDKLEQWIPQSPHITIMPNTAAAVGQGVIVCDEKNTLTPQMKETFVSLFSRLGTLVWLSGSQFEAGGVIAGCSPAWTAMYIDAMADAGVAWGLPRAKAIELSAAAVNSAAAMVLDGVHPALLKDSICSPAGTTIRGVRALEKDGLRHAVIDAVDAVMES